MKTPREVLLEQHRPATPKLDTVREMALAAIGDRRGASAMNPGRGYDLRKFFMSLRWHLAGMSAVWLVVAFLCLNAGQAPGRAAVPREKIPSAQIIMASLRENRRELLQMMQSPDSRDAGPQRLMLPQPRSQRHYENLTA